MKNIRQLIRLFQYRFCRVWNLITRFSISSLDHSQFGFGNVSSKNKDSLFFAQFTILDHYRFSSPIAFARILVSFTSDDSKNIYA